MKENERSDLRITMLVLHGTLGAALFLSALIITHGIAIQSPRLEQQLEVVAVTAIFLIALEALLQQKRKSIVNWALVSFFALLAFTALLIWGINAPIGILTITFAMTLPSVLIGVRAILPAVLGSISILISVQFIHQKNLVAPHLEEFTTATSTYWDVASYSTMLSIFALVSWLAGNQREKSLHRALLAETALQSQRNALKTELEKESSILRQTQLKQIRHLHNFALLGQSAAATLHELSNHLSILNFDIEDIRQQNSNSKAILHAKDSIARINKMVTQARKQLNSYEQNDPFDALAVIRQGIKDIQEKFTYRNVKLIKKITPKRGAFIVDGNSLALMQIVTVLLNNALDAIEGINNPEVTIETKRRGTDLLVTVSDNGPGVDPPKRKRLFSPITSNKSTGLGVGLYIARHLAREQLKGTIALIPTKHGAHFALTLPQIQPLKKSSHKVISVPTSDVT